MSSPERVDAGRVVARLRDLLSEEQIRRRVDGPIDEAMAAYTRPVARPSCAAEFHGALAAFVRCLYQRGVRPQRSLSRDEALADAIALIELAYPGRREDRYEGALLDATSHDDGLETVLATIGEAVKSRQRRKLVTWAVVRTVGHLQWADRCIIAEHLLHECARSAPEAVAGITPPMLADHILGLIDLEGDRLASEMPALEWLGF